MDSSSNIDLSLFTDVPEKEALETLYSLNQENTPEVGSLSTIDELSKLIDMSALNFYVLDDEEIIGFVVCFREGSGYKSLNYKFFNDNESKFLYIDRVVIKEGHRRKGAGTILYSHLQTLANQQSMPLCCEVNTIPRNSVSLDFHEKNGFIEVGECHFDDHSVAYLKKK